MVLGARQVGKTFIIQKFAEENYENNIYINFLENEDMQRIFDGNLDAETIYKQMSLRLKSDLFVPGKTLIFLDEIQVCPRAITALKFLSIDGKYDIICSGSMLGGAYKRVTSFPVGFIERIELFSLDFEEYCWANGMNEESIGYLKEYYEKKQQIPTSIHNHMMELFKEYIVVGGMPRVVQAFMNNHNFGRVLEIQRNIVDDYRDDIVKYADSSDKAKIRACFDSIPKHLAQKNKKFKYKLVDKNGNSKKYEGSLEWLYDAGIINFCYNLSNIDLPLEGNADENIFKVYMCDTGLLLSMLEDGSQKEIIDGNLGIYKGAIYENIIADIFTKLGKKLYYYSYNSTLEIDFIIRYNNKPCAVVVKSADNTKSKSLDSLLEKKKVVQGIKLSAKNIGLNDKNILSIPLYMAIFI